MYTWIRNVLMKLKQIGPNLLTWETYELDRIVLLLLINIGAYGIFRARD